MLTVTVRRITESTGKQFSGEPVEALRQALDCELEAGAEYNIESSDAEQLAFLDVDYHAAPNDEGRVWELQNALDRLPVQPAAAWISHGVGLKMAFVTGGGLTAKEVAAVALYAGRRQFAAIGGYSDSEIDDHTRHPMSVRDGRTCGMLSVCPDYTGFRIGDACRDALAEYPTADEEAVDEWLADHGFEKGRRYPHVHCPIEPVDCSRNDPVVCLDAGIYCHHCKVHGRGFRSYDQLVAGAGGEVERPTNVVKAMVRERCHWSHAKHVLTQMFGCNAKLVYSALLKSWHLHNVPAAKDDKDNKVREAKEGLIRKALSERVKIVRTASGWFHDDLKTPVKDRSLNDLLTGLPTLYFVDQKGKLGVDTVRRGELNGDAEIYGYPPILPIHGVDLARQAGLIGSGCETVRVEVRAGRHPFRYVEPHDRGDYEQHFAKYFPGVNLDLVRLGVGALAFAQTNAGEVPMIFITGQSASAKTRHAELAAVACGVEPKVIQFQQRDTDRFKSQYCSAADVGGIAIMDEFAKNAGRARADGSDIVAALTGFRSGMTLHRYHVGPATLAYAPPVILTDTDIPQYFREEVQIARRVIHVDLGPGILTNGGYDWRQTSRQNGASGILDWRDASPDNARACDCLASDVIDRIKASGYGGTFQGFAATLKFATVQNGTGDGTDPNDVYRDLFDAVCVVARQSDNEPTDPYFTGRGWAVVNLDTDTRAVRAFSAAVGEEVGDTRSTAFERYKQRLGGVQWGVILDVPAVELKLKRHGRKVGFKFHRGPVKGSGLSGTRFNYELLSEQTQSDTDQSANPAAIAA
jgi:hypothetical protein